ncbi:eukaryotic translation initiation factor 4E transporter isoform X2 [Eurosta solidaginis]
MSSSIDGSSHTAISSQDSLNKNCNYNITDLDITDNTNTNVFDGDVAKRYKRPKLLAIRQGLPMRCSPKSNLKAKLKFLGLWKINNNANLHQNDERTNNEYYNLSGALDQQTVHMPPARPNTRRYLSPSKQEQRLAYNGSQQNLSEPSISKTFIDHRSISSSHLMPAFVKKKMTASTINPSMTQTKVLLNSTGIGPNPLVAQTTGEYKNGIWGNTLSGTSYAPPRHRVKAHFGITANERRIGSGRLIPRQVDWESRNTHDNEKSPNSTKVVSITDKGALAKNHFAPQESGLATDRRFDHTAYNEHMDQQTFDRSRVSVDEHPGDNYEYSNSTKSAKTHSTGVPREDMPKFQPPALRNRNTRNYQYNDRNEEPEWFSGGPTSQHDTIELHGFEDIDEHLNITAPTGNSNRSTILTPSRKLSESSSSRASSTLNLNISKSREALCSSQDQEKDVKQSPNVSPKNVVSTCNNAISAKSNSSVDEEQNNLLGRNNDCNNTNPVTTHINQSSNVGSTNFLLDDTSQQNASAGLTSKEQDFSFDVFLNPSLDPLKHTLMRGDNPMGNADEVLGSSRFSRWFGNKPIDESTQPSTSTKNSSSTITELSNTNCRKSETNTLLEFLNKLPALPDSKPINKATSIPSVEELEARMRAIDTGKEDSFETGFTDITSISTEKKDNDINKVFSMDQEKACATPQEGEIQAFKMLLQKLGSCSMQQQQHQQQQLFFQQLLQPSNLQTGILTTPESRNAPIKPLHIMETGNTFGRAHLLQHMHVKNDDANIAHMQFKQQQQHNHGDITNVQQPQSETQNLSAYFANQPEKHFGARNFHQHPARGEIPINFLQQEINNSNAAQHFKEVTMALREMPDIERQTRQQSPLLGRNSEMPLSNQMSSNESFLHHIFDQKLKSNEILLDRNPQTPHFQHQNTQVMPGQRELQLHTQTIMQNAMRKKKIDDHQLQQTPQNSFRRQPIVTQQQQQQAHNQSTIQQQHRHINSSTPLAFTPTSVLRKMTAEKDNFNTSTADKFHSATTAGMQQQNKALPPENTFIKPQNAQQQMYQQPIATQPRMILGGKLSQPQQISNNNNTPPSGLTQSRPQPIQSMRSTPLNWPFNFLNHNIPATKPIGRPILKGSMSSQSTNPQHPPQSQTEFMLNHLDFQQIQQQRLKSQQQLVPFPQGSATSASIPSHSMLMTQAQQQQQVYQQRALALQRQQHQFHVQQQLHNQHQHDQPLEIYNHNICMISPLSSDTASSNSVADAAAETVRINYQRDGGLSPTSNQLAQWFSPELLAQANAGKLPLLKMNQTLSLAEFEKNMQHSSTTVHN